jgi:FkbM family methyltransferase
MPTARPKPTRVRTRTKVPSRFRTMTWSTPTSKTSTTKIRRKPPKPVPMAPGFLLCWTKAFRCHQNAKIAGHSVAPMADLSVHDSTDASADPVPSSDSDALYTPFGRYRLAPWREGLRAFGARLFPRRYPRLGSIINWPIWRLALLGRPGAVDLEPFAGFRLRLYPRENHADTKCFARAALCDLPEETAIACCAASTPDDQFIVVDVGANTGTYSVLCASLARQIGKRPNLTCIEANPKTQVRLAENLHFCRLDSHAKVVRSAVSDAPGTVVLDTGQWNLGSVKVTQTRGPLKAKQCVSVPARTLLAMVEDAGLPRIDFLKIDIEGHEVQALGPFLRSAPEHLLPRMILAETKHDKAAALASLILAAGYRITHHGRSDTVFER